MSQKLIKSAYKLLESYASLKDERSLLTYLPISPCTHPQQALQRATFLRLTVPLTISSGKYSLPLSLQDNFLFSRKANDAQFLYDMTKHTPQP